MENLEKLTTQMDKLVKVLDKSQKSAEESQGRFGKLDKGFSTLQSGVDKLTKAFTSLTPVVAGLFGGSTIINAVENYNRNLFEVNKTLNLTGQSMDGFIRVQDRLSKSTLLSKSEIVSLYDEMSKARGLRITTEEFEKLTNTLNRVYGPSQDRIMAGFKNLQDVQGKFPILFKEINRGIPTEKFNAFTAELLALNKITEEQADELAKYNDAVNGSGKIINDQTDKYKKLSETIQKLEAVGKDFLIQFGEPLAEIFQEAGKWIGDTAKKFLEFSNSGIGKMVMKIAAIGSVGAGLVGAVGGIGGAIKGILGMGRGSSPASPMYVQNVGSLTDMAGSLTSGMGGKGGVFAALTRAVTMLATAAVPLAVAAAALGAGAYAANLLQDEVNAYDSMNTTNKNLIDVKSRLGSQGGEIDAAERSLAIAAMKRDNFLDMNKGDVRQTAEFRTQLALLDEQVEAARLRKNELQDSLSVESGASPAGKVAAQERAKAEQARAMRLLYQNMILPGLQQEQSYLQSQMETNAKYVADVGEGVKLNNQLIESYRTQADEAKFQLSQLDGNLERAEKDFKAQTSIKDTKRDINVLIREAIAAGGKDAELAAKVVTAMQAQSQEKQKLLDISNKMKDAWKNELAPIETQKSVIEKARSLDEARLRLNESMLGPLGQNFELRSAIFDSLEDTIKQIGLEQQIVRSKYAEEKARGVERKDLQMKLLDLEAEKTEKIQKQVELTKSLRDGYLNALTSFNNVEGAFSKLVVTRETGLAMAMRQFKAAQGFGAGAIGAGGENPFMKWGVDGSLRMDNASDAYRRAQGYQKNYDTAMPTVFKDFGSSVNQLQKNAVIGGMNVSPMAGITGGGVSQSNDPHLKMLGKIVDNTGGTNDILKGKNTSTGGGGGGGIGPTNDASIYAAALKTSTMEIEGEKAKSIFNALKSGQNIPSFDDNKFDAKRKARTDELFKEMKSQMNMPDATIPSVPRVDTGTSRVKGGGQVSINFNIKGDSVASIMSAVDKTLGKTLTDMMGPSGSTGRSYELQVT